VRILNLKAEAATAVRRKFLTELVAGKTPPKSAAVDTATILAGHPGILGEYKVHGVLKEILPLNSKSSYVTVAVTDMIAKASPARAQVITLAMVLAAQESRIEKDGWRSVPAGCVAYLTFLSRSGSAATPPFVFSPKIYLHRWSPTCSGCISTQSVGGPTTLAATGRTTSMPEPTDRIEGNRLLIGV
jgi:hypothetical protein